MVDVKFVELEGSEGVFHMKDHRCTVCGGLICLAILNSGHLVPVLLAVVLTAVNICIEKILI